MHVNYVPLICGHLHAADKTTGPTSIWFRGVPLYSFHPDLLPILFASPHSIIPLCLVPFPSRLSPPSHLPSSFPSSPQREVDQSVEMLQSKNTELLSVLDYLRAQPENVDVDGAVSATSPLFNQ